MGSKYVYLNEHGQTEEIDVETGEVTKKDLSPTDLLDYHPVDHKGKIKWVPLKDSPAPAAYNPAIGELFVYRILDGSGIKKACAEVGLSYPLYCKWRKLYPEFKDMVDEARKDRGEQFFDKAEETAEAATPDEDEIALARLKIDTYKYLSSVSDPRRFGQKTQVAATVGIARLVVDTGIRREGEHGFEEAEVHGTISQRQEQIKEKEVAETPAIVSRPIGAQLTEAEKDGLVLITEDKNGK